MKIDFYTNFPEHLKKELYFLTCDGRIWNSYIRSERFANLTDVSTLTFEQKIVSWSCVTLIGDTYYVGCCTDPEYQKRGFGTLVTENTLKHTLHENLYYCADFFTPLLNKHNKTSVLSY